MDKTVYSGTILICISLMAGSIWLPDNAAMWLASTSPLMNITRIVIVGLMVGLVLTDPPRRRAFRNMLGLAAMILFSAAIWRTFSGSILLVDALVFLVTGISFFLAFLESQPLPRAVGTLPSGGALGASSARLLAGRAPNYVVSDVSGILWPRRSTDIFGRALILVSVITGALYQNIRPYRVLWRGS